jgi:hypothetical protein
MCSVKVVHMQVQVHLMRLITCRSRRRHMVRCDLHSHSPVTFHDVDVQVVVGGHFTSQQARSERLAAAMSFASESMTHRPICTPTSSASGLARSLLHRALPQGSAAPGPNRTASSRCR